MNSVFSINNDSSESELEIECSETVNDIPAPTFIAEINTYHLSNDELGAERIREKGMESKHHRKQNQINQSKLYMKVANIY